MVQGVLRFNGAVERDPAIAARLAVSFDESALEALISAAYRDISQGDY